MMKKLVLFLALGSLGGCLTLSGNYRVTATDANGQELNGGLDMIAQGSGIYPVRNGLCAVHRKAIIRITDLETGQELKSESPYKCR